MPDINVNALSEAINDKLDRDMDNLLVESTESKNIANWSNNVTNCITEIPQDIKLELNSGTIVLKAGSKVYVPNGFDGNNNPVFDVIITNEDKYAIGDTARTAMHFLRLGSIGIDDPIIPEYCFSGSTAPASFYFDKYAMWYDTTANLIKITADAGVTWTSGISFPLFIATETTTEYTSIDYVFNGFGYIGSHGFVLPGVKGLIPNGRNANGSLKTTEYIQSSVLICDLATGESENRENLMWGIGNCSFHDSSTISNYIHWGRNGGNVRYYKQRPAQSSKTYARAFIEDENKWIIAAGEGNYKWDENSLTNRFFEVGSYRLSSGKITDFSINNVVLVTPISTQYDYVVETLRPTSTNNYTWYRLYKSGWVEQGGRATVGQDSRVNITLPISMNSTTYQILITANSSGTIRTGGDGNYSATPTSVSAFDWMNGDDYTITNGWWEVKGFAA